MGKVASNVDFSIQKYTSDASKTTLPVLKVEKVASNHDLWFQKSIFDASDLNFFKKNDEKWHFSHFPRMKLAFDASDLYFLQKKLKSDASKVIFSRRKKKNQADIYTSAQSRNLQKPA
jgi:hypothetical protein